MDLRIFLRDEYARRVSRNRRYSLRAFARFLSVHHATLVRVLAGDRGLSRSLLRRVAVRLRMSPAEVDAAIATEDARRILHVASAVDFRPDCRWIAMKSGIDVDDVNRAIHRMLHERRLIMSSASSWTVVRP